MAGMPPRKHPPPWPHVAMLQWFFGPYTVQGAGGLPSLLHSRTTKRHIGEFSVGLVTKYWTEKEFFKKCNEHFSKEWPGLFLYAYTQVKGQARGAAQPGTSPDFSAPSWYQMGWTEQQESKDGVTLHHPQPRTSTRYCSLNSPMLPVTTAETKRTGHHMAMALYDLLRAKAHSLPQVP